MGEGHALPTSFHSVYLRAEKTKVPLNIFVQVQATHPYAGEDTDELTFGGGDVINVVPFDDPEDQVRFVKIILWG